MNHEPLVSIITPTRNSEKFLLETVESINRQIYNNIEWIVVDANSIDNTFEIVKKSRFPFRFIEEVGVDGMYAALNQGIDISNGEILCYINSDDILYENAVACAVNHLMQDDHFGLVYGDLDLIDESSKFLRNVIFPKFNQNKFLSLRHSTIGQPSSFWKREVILRTKGFNSEFKASGDYDFFLRASYHYEFKHVRETLAAFRVHEESISSKRMDWHNLEIQKIQDSYWKSRWFAKIIFKIYAYIEFKVININNYL